MREIKLRWYNVHIGAERYCAQTHCNAATLLGCLPLPWIIRLFARGVTVNAPENILSVALYKPCWNPGAKRPVFEIIAFSTRLATIPRPAKRAKARLYCPKCERHHHFQWGEMQNAVKDGASSLEEIVGKYAWKYCRSSQRTDGYVYSYARVETKDIGIGAANDLLATILDIPGNKIITLYRADGTEFKIDISAQGRFGYAPGHKALFVANLVSAIGSSSVLVIRQFLPLKVERQTPNDKTMFIPKKKLYGIVLANGAWKPISATQMREAHCTNSDTGESIEPEQDVIFAEVTDYSASRS